MQENEPAGGGACWVLAARTKLIGALMIIFSALGAVA